MINEKGFQDFWIYNPNKKGFFKKSKVDVLLVEDNKIIQLIHKEILVKLGCQVDIVSSGEEALSVIDNDYEIIFLDIGLPGISGIDVVTKFREHKNHEKTRMVVITANSELVNNNILFSCGIEKVLAKPVDIKDLAAIVYQLDTSCEINQSAFSNST